MSRMSKKLINKLSMFSLCFILLFSSISHSSEKENNFKSQFWIEDVPILSSLIENKIDVVEFDSSNGKIISISFDIKNLSKKQIFSFYNHFFEKKNGKRVKIKMFGYQITKDSIKRFLKLRILKMVF